MEISGSEAYIKGFRVAGSSGGIFTGESRSAGAPVERDSTCEKFESSGDRHPNDRAIQSSLLIRAESSFEEIVLQGPGDSREALLLKEELKKVLKRIEMQATSIKNAAKHYKTGTFPIGRTLSLALTRTEEGKTQMIVAKQDGSLSEITVYDSKNPEDLEYIKEDDKGALSISRKGSAIEARGTDGTVSFFEIREGALIVKKNERDTKRDYFVSGDGSVEIRETSKNDKGIPVSTTRSVPGDKGRRAWHAFVLENGHNLDDKGITAALSDEQSATITDGLSSYPAGLIERFQREGIKIAIVDRAHTPAGGYPGMGSWPLGATGMNPATGYYSSRSKIIVIDRDSLDKDIIVHEAAHALDDIQVPDGERLWGLLGKKINQRTDNDRDLKKLYREYGKRSEKKEEVWSDYGLSNIQEYYAEGFKFFLGDDRQKEILKSRDPGLYSFIAQNLGQ